MDLSKLLTGDIGVGVKTKEPPALSADGSLSVRPLGYKKALDWELGHCTLKESRHPNFLDLVYSRAIGENGRGC